MIAMNGLIEAEPGARLNGICMFHWWGFGVLAVVYSLLLKSSAARAAHRELRSLQRLFRASNTCANARDRPVRTTRYRALRQGDRAQIPQD